MKERNGIKYTVGSGRVFLPSLEDAGRAAVSSPYIISPARLVIYEVHPVVVNAVVRDRKWHFTRVEE